METEDGAQPARDGPCAPRRGGRAVPRQIHQVFFPRAELPQPMARSIARMKALNPGWDHVLWDEPEIAGFVRQEYGREVAGYLDRINPAYGVVKVDLFRYLLMYRCGGVYLDGKSYAAAPLDEIVRPDDRYILSQWRNGPGAPYEGFGIHPELASLPGGEFQQWHIIAEPGHPYLAAVIRRVLRNIDRYNPAIHRAGQHGVLRLTGPIAYTQALMPIVERHPHRRVRDETELALEFSIFGPGLAHRQGLANHYSVCREPIVRSGPLTRATAAVIEAARSIKGQVLRPAALPTGS